MGWDTLDEAKFVCVEESGRIQDKNQTLEKNPILKIQMKDCGGIIFKKDTGRFYLRKQRACFRKEPGGASFVRPTGCISECDSKIANEYSGEVCVEIETKERKHDQYIQLQTTNLCPYQVSDFSKSMSWKNEAYFSKKCAPFRAINREPFIKIFANESKPVSST